MPRLRRETPHFPRRVCYRKKKTEGGTFVRTLYVGGPIYPACEKDSRVEAVVVEDGRIAFCGPYEKAKEWGGARRVDLEGRCMLPAFLDAHGHFLASAQYTVMADLSGCRSFEDVVRVLREFARRRGGAAVWGFGLDETLLREGCLPGRDVIDRACPSVPALVLHVSNHSAVANSLLLQEAGVGPDTPDPPGGQFAREPDGRTPAGIAEELPALRPLYEAMGKRFSINYRDALPAMERLYLSHGIVTVQDGASTREGVEMLAALAEEGRLKLDVVSYVMAEEAPEIFEKYANDCGAYRGHYRIGGVKLLLDGSPQRRTAWMTRPYAGAEDCGVQAHTDAAVYAAARWAIDRGVQLLAHCNGDAAADQFLRCYRRALCDSPFAGKAGLRPVMIHCQCVRPDQLAQMMPLKMVPSFFAAHIRRWGDVHLKNLGPARGGAICPMGTARRLGLPFTIHTDTPVLPPDLLESVACAVNRTTRGGKRLSKDERVPVEAALQAVTGHAAYTYFEEREKGRLFPGARADFIFLDGDPFAVPPAALSQLSVLRTVGGGEVLYASPLDPTD